MRHLALAALILLGACAPGPARVVEPRTSDAPAPRGTMLLRAAMLDGQNAARAAVDSPPLTWDAGLAVDAKIYANWLARNRRFEHAVQADGPTHEGENLWTGTRDAYSFPEMVGHWVAEGKEFVNGPTPQFSRTGRSEDVSHYTQIVWRTTTTMGCAIASNETDDIVVCRYRPSGNVVGWKAL